MNTNKSKVQKQIKEKINLGYSQHEVFDELKAMETGLSPVKLADMIKNFPSLNIQQKYTIADTFFKTVFLFGLLLKLSYLILLFFFNTSRYPLFFVTIGFIFNIVLFYYLCRYNIIAYGITATFNTLVLILSLIAFLITYNYLLWIDLSLLIIISSCSIFLFLKFYSGYSITKESHITEDEKKRYRLKIKFDN